MTAKNEKTENKPDTNVGNEKLSTDMAIALEAQARMAKDREDAPDGVTVTNVKEDAMDALVKRYVPEAIATPLAHGTKRQKDSFMDGASKRAFWGVNSSERHSQLVLEGWMPVTRVISGKTVQVTSPGGGMLLYERPVVYTIDSVNRAAEVSNNRMNRLDGSLRENLPSDMIHSDETTINKE